jgi:hypothetical protein
LYLYFWELVNYHILFPVNMLDIKSVKWDHNFMNLFKDGKQTNIMTLL